MVVAGVMGTGTLLGACHEGSSTDAAASGAAQGDTPASAATVTLNWQAPTENSDGSPLTDLSGYKIYYGSTAGNYSSNIPVPNPGLTTYVVENLAPGRYYFAVTSYNSQGVESAMSPEVAATTED
jgi:Fibronectin type III domain